MYHALVRRRVRGVFASLSAGDYRDVLPGLATGVAHEFAGNHALGGKRYGRDAVERWFERLYRLFPDLAFEVRRVIATGGPWSTEVAVEWTATVTPLRGERYSNEGVHVLRIRWGRVVYLHAYEDSQKVAEACRTMAAEGIAEAAAEPLHS